MDYPEVVRNVAIVGSLHHGKTAFMDMMILATHKMPWDLNKQVFFLFFPKK